MKKSRFTGAQMIDVLQEHEKGAQVPDLCRKHGITEPTFDRWRRKFGGLQLSEAARLRQLADGNRRLKQLVAEQALDDRVLQELLGKQW
jgi:putative transposase